ncbi:MAG: hypothetical protein JO128_00215 [Alphaproteobacteria bacterium]|nr:hypothetical protein [Alphaproteobacteria bacterium]
MSEAELSAAELRAKAQEHREAARLDNNPTSRNAHLKIAIEYERFAEIKDRKGASGEPTA